MRKILIVTAMSVFITGCVSVTGELGGYDNLYSSLELYRLSGNEKMSLRTVGSSTYLNMYIDHYETTPHILIDGERLKLPIGGTETVKTTYSVSGYSAGNTYHGSVRENKLSRKSVLLTDEMKEKILKADTLVVKVFLIDKSKSHEADLTKILPQIKEFIK
jgi:hypothetical protein